MCSPQHVWNGAILMMGCPLSPTCHRNRKVSGLNERAAASDASSEDLGGRKGKITSFINNLITITASFLAEEVYETFIN